MRDYENPQTDEEVSHVIHHWILLLSPLGKEAAHRLYRFYRTSCGLPVPDAYEKLLQVMIRPGRML